MEIRYEKHWSGNLNRFMEFKIYGSTGKPVLFIPCQAGRFWDFESFKMTDTWAPWIESGEVMVFSCDSIDNEAWAALGADNRWRIENHEKWFNYITTELVPAIHFISGRYDIMTFGASMGGLMSLYAATCYNKVFSKAACLSPSLWTNPEKLRKLIGKAKIAPDTTIYMDYGSEELANHGANKEALIAMTGKLLEKNVNLAFRIVPGGNHSEGSWEKQIPIFMDCLGL